MNAQERRLISLSDVIAVVVCVLVFVAVLSTNPGGIFGHARVGSRRMQNGTQVRGIQQSFVLYAYSNNGFYPGYNSDGTDDFAAVAASTTNYGCNALADSDIGKVYAIQLTGEFFTPEYIVSPSDDLFPAPYPSQGVGPLSTIDNTMYSYALLDMNNSPSARRDEWKDTNNSQAPIVADPSSDIRPMFNLTYHTDMPWMANSDVYYEGNFAWNDNHVTFQNKGQFPGGTLKLGNTLNANMINPFKAWGDDEVKFIW